MTEGPRAEGGGKEPQLRCFADRAALRRALAYRMCRSIQKQAPYVAPKSVVLPMDCAAIPPDSKAAASAPKPAPVAMDALQPFTPRRFA